MMQFHCVLVRLTDFSTSIKIPGVHSLESGFQDWLLFLASVGMPYNIWMDAHTAICQDPDNNFIKYVNCSGTQQPRILLSMPSAQKHFSGNTEAINFQLAFVFSGLTGVGSVPWHTGIWGEGKKERTWKQQRPGRTGPDHWRPLCFISPPKWNVYIYMYIAIYIPDNPQASRLAAARVWGVAVTSASHQYIY